MNEQQIENWRKVLYRSIGPYALFMPVEEIEKIKDWLQQELDALEESIPFSEGQTVWVNGTKKAYIKEVGSNQTKVKWAWGGTEIVSNMSIKLEKNGNNVQ